MRKRPLKPWHGVVFFVFIMVVFFLVCVPMQMYWGMYGLAATEIFFSNNISHKTSRISSPFGNAHFMGERLFDHPGGYAGAVPFISSPDDADQRRNESSDLQRTVFAVLFDRGDIACNL